MPVRMALTKATGQGEQIVIDVCQWNPVTGEIVHPRVADMQALFDEVLAQADVRLMEMNTRMLEAYGLETYFAPAIWSKIVALLDILAGRQDAGTVARRWQSEVEENAALEAGRLQAHEATKAPQGAQVCKECTWSSAALGMSWCRPCMLRLHRDIGDYLALEAGYYEEQEA